MAVYINRTESYVRNCVIIGDGGSDYNPLVVFNSKGGVEAVRLDGFAIVALSEWDRVVQKYPTKASFDGMVPHG